MCRYDVLHLCFCILPSTVLLTCRDVHNQMSGKAKKKYKHRTSASHVQSRFRRAHSCKRHSHI